MWIFDIGQKAFDFWWCLFFILLRIRKRFVRAVLISRAVFNCLSTIWSSLNRATCAMSAEGQAKCVSNFMTFVRINQPQTLYIHSCLFSIWSERCSFTTLKSHTYLPQTRHITTKRCDRHYFWYWYFSPFFSRLITSAKVTYSKESDVHALWTCSDSFSESGRP